ncbi:MAG TPA: secretin and TonB N-terminal domain-containing protein [Armatimonadota bacterium]|nr:secretin and TonB N-terminal domain-containing protein [Armatimonadota bacterium]
MKARMMFSLNHGIRLVLVALMLSCMSILYATPGQVRIDSLNFVNAEVATVLKSLADVSGANIVASPDVKGAITVKLHDVTVEQALQIIANMTGFSYRLSNGIYMVGKADGNKSTLAMDRNYIIIKLQVASPEDVIGALGVAYADLQVKSLPDKRLILSGEANRLTAAKAFVQEIDQPTAATPATAPVEMAEETYRLKAVIPWQAKQYLEELYKGQGLNVSYAPTSRQLDAVISAPSDMAAAKEDVDKKAGSQGAANVAQVATAWQSDQLILRGPKAVVNQALASVQKIDVSAPVAQKRCQVKRIYATQAIAYLLSQFESRGLSIITAPMNYNPGDSTQAGAKAGINQIGTKVVRDKDGKLNVSEPVGDFILIGQEDVVNDAMAALEKIDVGPERVEHIYTLRFLQVNEAKAKLEELYGKEGLRITVAPMKRGETLNMVTEATATIGDTKQLDTFQSQNRVFEIVLSGPEDVVNRAEQLLQSLDSESPQISISTEIISVDSKESKQLGIDWPGSITTSLNETQSGDPLRIGRIIRDPVSFNVTVNALQTRNKAKIISRPSTVVENGREAVIHVGDKILYEVLSGINNGTPVYSTSNVDAGVTLKVLPQMSKDGIITLQISSNVSDLVKFNTGISGAQLPQLRETANTTVVQVRDGEMLVIGGLTQNTVVVDKKSVPILGDIPLIGTLFSTKTTTPSNTELMIVVTPKLVKPVPAAPVTNPAGK